MPVTFSKLKLEAGDLLVVGVDEPMTMDDFARFTEDLRKQMQEQSLVNQVLIVPLPVQVGALKKREASDLQLGRRCLAKAVVAGSRIETGRRCWFQSSMVGGVTGVITGLSAHGYMVEVTDDSGTVWAVKEEDLVLCNDDGTEPT